MSNGREFLPPVISFPKKTICLGWTHNLLLSFFFFFSFRKSYNTVTPRDFYLYFMQRDQILISRMPNSVVESSCLMTWL